jgi:hypothetical protein
MTFVFLIEKAPEAKASFCCIFLFVEFGRQCLTSTNKSESYAKPNETPVFQAVRDANRRSISRESSNNLVQNPRTLTRLSLKSPVAIRWVSK